MTSITQSIDGTFSSIASRIASLTPTLSEVTSRLLTHAYNDISDDLDALKAKVERFAAQIDSVEHDNSRQSLVAEAERKFAQVIASIKSAANASELATGRKVVDTLNVWQDDLTASI